MSSTTSSSITSNIPAGTTYHFNPYANQGNLPWIVVPPTTTGSAPAPAPKAGAPSPIAFADSDDEGLTQADISVDNGSFPSGGSTPNTVHLPQPIRHIIPNRQHYQQQQTSNNSGHLQYVAPHQHQHHHQQHQQQVNTSPHHAQIAPAYNQSAPSHSHSPTSSFQTPRSRIPTSDGSIVHGNVHTTLGDFPVSYVSYTDLRHLAAENAHQQYYQRQNNAAAGSGSMVKLFVGQVLHELRPSELSTIFGLLGGTAPAKVTPHGPGCFFIEVPTAQFRNARQLNAKILFDVHGFWFAEHQDSADLLKEYVASVKQGLKTMRLPRSTLVVRR